MTWIRTADPEQDPEWNELRAELMERPFLAQQDRLPNIVEVLSLNPGACRSIMDLHEAVTFGGSVLGERLEQMISLVVSVLNECHYWTEAHGALLRTVTQDQELVDGLKEDPAAVTLPESERAVIDFVTTLHEAPESLGEEELETLREHGYDDRAILDIVLLEALYEVMNRVADGLGVELDMDLG